MSKHSVSVQEIMKINARRQRNARKGLLPFLDRVSQQEADKREAKIWARRTVAEKLIARQHQMGLVLHNFFSRTFFGRVKWAFTGK